MRTIIIALFIFAILFSSCGESPCAKTELRYALVGFSDSESDSIVLRRFTKNTFQLIDTFEFIEPTPLRFSRSNDTLKMAAIPGTALLESNYDYQIYFPKAGKLFTITVIVEEQLAEKKGGLFNTKKPMCLNRISSCKVNGQQISFSSFNEIIYLRR